MKVSQIYCNESTSLKLKLCAHSHQLINDDDCVRTAARPLLQSCASFRYNAEPRLGPGRVRRICNISRIFWSAVYTAIRLWFFNVVWGLDIRGYHTPGSTRSHSLCTTVGPTSLYSRRPGWYATPVQEVSAGSPWPNAIADEFHLLHT